MAGSRFIDPDDSRLRKSQSMPLFRVTDPDTSVEAGEKIKPHISGLQAVVLGAFYVDGEMTAKECEALPVLSHCAPSTARKRCSELVAKGLLEPTGEKRGGCQVLRVVK